MHKLYLIGIALILAGFILPENNKKKPPVVVDGPYVLYDEGRITVYHIIQKDDALKLKRDSYDSLHKEAIRISVKTDEPGKTFSFPLQNELAIQPSVYAEPSRMFILSDIEANFPAFRKLLLEGAVIDSAFNWTFGNGHLVLTGDFVDRGTDQMEVLWLIYSLEEKAKAAGGYVHYILGNHEIMNLSGDLRYLQPKYLATAQLMKMGYTSLIGENTELGRWLRTKNVVEKIGNMLFTHGGISSSMNSLSMPVDTINKLSRPYYADSIYHYTDTRLDTLYGDAGPFWFRGYYKNTNGNVQPMIDSTLDIYKVSHIATGHTIIADTISVLFNNKLFNTDVHHAGGHTEALLKEGSKFFRIVGGERKLLADVSGNTRGW